MKLFDRIRDDKPAGPDPHTIVRLTLEDWLVNLFIAAVCGDDE